MLIFVGSDHRHPGFARFDALLTLVVLALVACAGAKLKPGPVPAPSILLRPVGHIALRNTPLDQAIKKLGAAAGVSIVVDWRALAAAEIHPGTTVSLDTHDQTLGDALGLLPLRPAVLEESGTAVHITTAEALPAVARIYDVHDIVERMGASRFVEDVNAPVARVCCFPNGFVQLPAPPVPQRQDITQNLAEFLTASDRMEGSTVECAAAGLIVLHGPRRAHVAFAAALQRVRASDRLTPWTPRSVSRTN